MIKEPLTVKYSHRNSDSIITGCLSDPNNSEDIHSTSVPREFYEFFSLKIKQKKFHFRFNSL